MDILEDICDSISLSQNFDDEIRMELMSHMEDKLTGYLDGSEEVTEEDALLLVREHFGDPAVIRSLFQEVEGVGANVSFWRKLAAIATLTVVTLEWGKFLLEVMFSGITYWLHKGDIVISPVVFGVIYKDVPSLVVLMAFFYYLTTWKRKLSSGQQTWFERIKAPYLVIITISSYIVLAVTVMFLLKFQARMLLIDFQKGFPIHQYRGIGLILVPTLMYFGWLYWFDNKRNRLMSLCMAFISCYLFEISFKLFLPWFTGTLHHPASIFSSIPKLLQREIQYVKPSIIAVLLYLILEAVYSVRQKIQHKLRPQITKK